VVAAGSPASVQLPLQQQGPSFPVSTSSTSLSAASVPVNLDVPQIKVEASPDTTPRARPMTLISGVADIPSISLSVEDEENDEPSFPAINSAQRASSNTSSSLHFHKLNGSTRPLQPAGFAMPSPPLPQIRGRNPRSPPTVLAPSVISRQSEAAFSRRSASQSSLFPAGTSGGTAISVNGGISSIESSTLAVPYTTKSTRKVTLEPGHSPLDWARLCRTASPEVLRGPDIPQGLLRVTPSMLANHGRPRKSKTRDTSSINSDEGGSKGMVWMALEGKVYNVTAYIPFHPGGEGELLRCAGKNGTSLFMKTHSWVNIDGMLGGCLVGILVSEEEGDDSAVKVGLGLEDVD